MPVNPIIEYCVTDEDGLMVPDVIPVEPTEGDTCGPVDPETPVAPVGPVEPVGPVDPVKPVEPDAPCTPEAPCAPVAPCGPVAPVYDDDKILLRVVMLNSFSFYLIY